MGNDAGFHPCTPAGILSLHPYSGNNYSYHTNNFPVKRGRDHAGFHPTPHKGHRPLTQFRMLLDLSRKQFPGGAWGTMEGRCPFQPHKGHCPLTRCRILQYDFAGNVPVLQGNTHRPIHKRTTEVLRVGCGTAAHAETPLQNQIAYLRIGCGTATHGLGGVKHRRPDALHPGKMRKNRQESELS